MKENISSLRKGIIIILLNIYVLNLFVCVPENGVVPDPDPPPDTTYWTKKFGGSENDFGWSVQQTIDSGFIIVGQTRSFIDYDVYLIRTDSYGKKLWEKTFGGNESDGGEAVLQTNDSGFIIAGHTWSYGLGGCEVYLIRTDFNGNLVWTKTFGGTGDDGAWSLDMTSDNGFIIAGFIEPVGSGSRDVYLIRTDANGDSLWTKTYGKDSLDWANAVRQTSDGGFIIAGCTDSLDTYTEKDNREFFMRDMLDRGVRRPNTRDVYLIRTDPNGDTLWTKTYGGQWHDGAYSVQQTSDGGFIIAGETWSYGAGSADVYLIKTDSNGDTLWTKTFGGSSLDKGYSIVITNDGGFAIAGETSSFGGGGGLPDVYLILTNSSGDLLWYKTYDEGKYDKGHSVQQTFDGGFVIAGYTHSNSGGGDVYLVKQDKPVISR